MTSVIGMIIFFTIQTICTARFYTNGSPEAAHAVIAFIFLYYAAYEYVFFASKKVVSHSVQIVWLSAPSL